MLHGQDKEVRLGFTVGDFGGGMEEAIEKETSSMIDKNKATTPVSLEESLKAPGTCWSVFCLVASIR